MTKIPIAEEFLEQNGCERIPNEIGVHTTTHDFYTNVQPKDLIEFARLHVKAALEVASKNVKTISTARNVHRVDINMNKEQIMRKEDHLENIAIILRKFKKKYNFLKYYLHISGIVNLNVSSSLNIHCYNEFDNKTLSQIKEINHKLYEEIRKYLDKNQIIDTLYIETDREEQYIYFKQRIKA